MLRTGTITIVRNLEVRADAGSLEIAVRERLRDNGDRGRSARVSRVEVPSRKYPRSQRREISGTDAIYVGIADELVVDLDIGVRERSTQRRGVGLGEGHNARHGAQPAVEIAVSVRALR